MAAVALLNVAVVVLRKEGEYGFLLGAPEQLPLYILAASRLGAAAILVVGGAAAINVVTRSPRVRRTLVMPVAVVTVATVVLYLIREQSRTSTNHSGVIGQWASRI